MALLDKIRLALRMDDNNLDEDIQDTIDAAKADLELNGIIKAKISDTDSLIIRAIKTYCKAEFSSDEKESDRYRQSYEMLKDHLSLSLDYTYFAVTINTGRQCTVIFNGEVKQSDDSGKVIFYTKPQNHIEYVVNNIAYYVDITADKVITVVV